MTLEELKKDKIAAMKAHEGDAVTAYNALISRLMLMATDPNHGRDITEADIVSAASKTEKELLEEQENFRKAGREETVAALEKQIETIRRYIPAMMSAEEIKTVILSLEDRSVPAVMKHFKANYAGKYDMKLVNETLRSL